MFKLEELIRARKMALNCLMFVKIGDFYECYGDDAVTMSEMFGLVITGRNLSQKTSSNTEESVRVKMVGIPSHSLKHYFSHIVGNGKSAAVFIISPADAVDGDYIEELLVPIDATDNKLKLRLKMANELNNYQRSAQWKHDYHAAYDFVYATDIYNLFWDVIVPNYSDEDINALIDTGCPLSTLLDAWVNDSRTIDALMTEVMNDSKDFVRELKFSELNYAQCCVLDKIATKSKMDTWFAISDNLRYIFDVEEGTSYSFKEGIEMLVDGMTSYKDYDLSVEEIAVFEEMCDVFGVSYSGLKEGTTCL